MPTYEYRCPEGHTFERFQKMSDSAGATCPECGAPAERQISGGAGFLFKGDGFYITDYRSDDYRKKADAEKGGGAGKKDAGGGAEKSAASGEASKADSSGGSGKEAAGGAGKGAGTSSSGSSGSSSEGADT